MTDPGGPGGPARRTRNAAAVILAALALTAAGYLLLHGLIALIDHAAHHVITQGD